MVTFIPLPIACTAPVPLGDSSTLSCLHLFLHISGWFSASQNSSCMTQKTLKYAHMLLMTIQVEKEAHCSHCWTTSSIKHDEMEIYLILIKCKFRFVNFDKLWQVEWLQGKINWNWTRSAEILLQPSCSNYVSIFLQFIHWRFIRNVRLIWQQ